MYKSSLPHAGFEHLKGSFSRPQMSFFEVCSVRKLVLQSQFQEERRILIVISKTPLSRQKVTRLHW